MRRLVIRPGAIGDVIVSLPAMECLRADYLEVWTPARTAPLIRFADQVRSIASTGLDLLELGDRAAIAQMAGFDSVVSWYGSRRAEFRQAVRGLPFTFFDALPPAGCPVPAAEFYLEQVRTLVACASDGIPRIECPSGREDFAVIHPFSGSARKNWPLAKFQALARQLERVMPVRWCAGEEDPPPPDAVRIANLYDLGCWLAKARLFIGNDSGISHLAAAVGTPVLAIFGTTDPTIWAPRGPHVRVATAIMDSKG